MEQEVTEVGNWPCGRCSRYHLVLAEATDIGERVLCGSCTARDFGAAALPLPSFLAPGFPKPGATVMLTSAEYAALQAVAAPLLPPLPSLRSTMVSLAANVYQLRYLYQASGPLPALRERLLLTGRSLSARLRASYQAEQPGDSSHPTIRQDAKVAKCHYCPTAVVWGLTARHSPNPYTVDERREPIIVAERLKSGLVREVPLSHWKDCANPPQRGRT